MKKKKNHPKFLVDKKGNRITVQLDIKAYEVLLEELEDLYAVVHAEKIISKKAKTHTLEELEKSLLGKVK